MICLRPGSEPSLRMLVHSFIQRVLNAPSLPDAILVHVRMWNPPSVTDLANVY